MCKGQKSNLHTLLTISARGQKSNLHMLLAITMCVPTYEQYITPKYNDFLEMEDLEMDEMGDILEIFDNYEEGEEEETIMLGDNPNTYEEAVELIYAQINGDSWHDDDDWIVFENSETNEANQNW